MGCLGWRRMGLVIGDVYSVYIDLCGIRGKRHQEHLFKTLL